MSWNTAPMMPRNSTSGLQRGAAGLHAERTPSGRHSAVTVDTRLAFGREQLATSGARVDAPSSRLWHVARAELIAASRSRRCPGSRARTDARLLARRLHEGRRGVCVGVDVMRTGSAPATEGTPVEKGVGHGKTIVVVNDSPELLELAEMLLSDEDFDVKVALSGAGALELIRTTAAGSRDPRREAPGRLGMGHPSVAEAGSCDERDPGAGLLGGGPGAAGARTPAQADGRRRPDQAVRDRHVARQGTEADRFGRVVVRAGHRCRRQPVRLE